MINRFSAALAALSLVACGPPPDYVTQRGVSIYSQGVQWDFSLVEEQESWFVERLDPLSNGYRRDLTEKAMRDVVVYLYTDKIPCGSSSPTGYCNGVESYGTLHVRDMGCVFNSAYTHEMMHWFQERIHDYIDTKHGEQNIWPIADGAPRNCPTGEQP